jgi:hypothetical protein
LSGITKDNPRIDGGKTLGLSMRLEVQYAFLIISSKDGIAHRTKAVAIQGVPSRPGYNEQSVNDGKSQQEP